MQFKKFLEGWSSDATMQYQARVTKGRARESQIMNAMKTNCKLEVTPAPNHDDILRGIDCYVTINRRIYPTQIKTRQSNEDLLFVISEDGKPGRDMKTQAELYAFLINENLYLIKTTAVRKAINDLVGLMNKEDKNQDKFSINYKGVDCELSRQNDPVSGSSKLMAFIHPSLFTDFIDPIISPCRISI